MGILNLWIILWLLQILRLFSCLTIVISLLILMLVSSLLALFVGVKPPNLPGLLLSCWFLLHFLSNIWISPFDSEKSVQRVTSASVRVRILPFLHFSLFVILCTFNPKRVQKSFKIYQIFFIFVTIVFYWLLCVILTFERSKVKKLTFDLF